MSEPTDEYSTVVSQLKFLATLQIGEKIDVQRMQAQANGIQTAISRYLAGQTRETTLSFLTALYGRAKSLRPTISERQQVNLDEAIIASRQGVLALRSTYASDRMFVARVDAMIEDIHPVNRDDNL